MVVSDVQNDYHSAIYDIAKSTLNTAMQSNV